MNRFGKGLSISNKALPQVIASLTEKEREDFKSMIEDDKIGSPFENIDIYRQLYSEKKIEAMKLSLIKKEKQKLLRYSGSTLYKYIGPRRDFNDLYCAVMRDLSEAERIIIRDRLGSYLEKNNITPFDEPETYGAIYTASEITAIREPMIEKRKAELLAARGVDLYNKILLSTKDNLGRVVIESLSKAEHKTIKKNLEIYFKENNIIFDDKTSEVYSAIYTFDEIQKLE